VETTDLFLLFPVKC